jgi:hypothetical protein
VCDYQNEEAVMAKKQATKASTKALEQKFDETAFRLSQERNDFLLPQIADFVRGRKWLNLRPEYQRRLVWDVGKRSRFIESLLLNVPIPPVFLYEWELGRYEVMDGQQRLNAVVEFYENGFALKGLERWTELHGLRYRDLPETLQRGLDRRRLSATVLLVERPTNDRPQHDDVRKLVFNRLNTGGQQLNAQELRNCLFEGPFNQLLIDLSRYRPFQEAWEIPLYEEHVDAGGRVQEPLASHPLYKRMTDCELVLRFFAFRRRSKVRGSVRSILDKCMAEYSSAPPEKIQQMGQDFRERLDTAVEVFGAEVFRPPVDDESSRPSQGLYDAIMVGIDRLWEDRKALIVNQAAIREAVRELLEDDDVVEVVVGRPNTAKAILERIDLVEKALQSA